MLNPSSPVTGAAVSGLTSPTYTLTADTAPVSNGKQWAVTALGGTQTGVTTHSTSSPFTITSFKAANVKVLGSVVPSTGQLSAVPKNNISWLLRKGMIPLAGQSPSTQVITLSVSTPAGSDLAAAAEIKAAASCFVGFLWSNVQALVDLVLTNTH